MPAARAGVVAADLAPGRGIIGIPSGGAGLVARGRLVNSTPTIWSVVNLRKRGHKMAINAQSMLDLLKLDWKLPPRLPLEEETFNEHAAINRHRTVARQLF